MMVTNTASQYVMVTWLLLVYVSLNQYNVFLSYSREEIRLVENSGVKFLLVYYITSEGDWFIGIDSCHGGGDKIIFAYPAKLTLHLLTKRSLLLFFTLFIGSAVV